MEVAASLLLRSMDYYMITLSAEMVSRQTDIWVEPPTLENIFHEDRENEGDAQILWSTLNDMTMGNAGKDSLTARGPGRGIYPLGLRERTRRRRGQRP